MRWWYATGTTPRRGCRTFQAKPSGPGGRCTATTIGRRTRLREHRWWLLACPPRARTSVARLLTWPIRCTTASCFPPSSCMSLLYVFVYSVFFPFGSLGSLTPPQALDLVHGSVKRSVSVSGFWHPARPRVSSSLQVLQATRVPVSISCTLLKSCSHASGSPHCWPLGAQIPRSAPPDSCDMLSATTFDA